MRVFSPQVILQIVLFFFVLVTIHEWGHFYFAKRAGILVREFAIGFGPRLFSFKRGETRYTLRILPIGGFVRMAGEDPEIVQVNPGQRVALQLRNGQVSHIYLDQLDQRSGAIQGIVERIDLDRELFVEVDVDEQRHRYQVNPQAMMVSKGRETQIAPWDRQFGSKTVGQRALAIFAGPFMNFVLAFCLFIVVSYMAGVAINVKIGDVSPGSPAEKAGLSKGDIILNVNQTDIGVKATELTRLIKESPDKPMSWVVQRNNERVTLQVTPALDKEKGTTLVGVTLVSDKRDATISEAFAGGWDNLVLFTKNILLGFKMLLTLQFSWDDLGGPVRIVEVTGEHASAGLLQYMFWAAVMSLYLGIFNLLPFPALDGSRLVFLGLEALRGKPVDPNRESMVHFIGFAMLMLLMVAVTYNDILRLIKG
jgi:regulator of sigma E protease